MSHCPDPLLSARFKNIQGTVLSPVSKLGLSEYINRFGNLLFGTLRPEIFLQQFNALKEQHIFWQINSPFEDFKEIQPVQFYMHMLHEAQKISSWRWPGLINNLSKFRWINGNSRLFATGMTKQQPSKLLNFLILQNFSVPTNTYINDPIVVSNDDILHSILNVSQDDDPWLPHCEILLTYNIDNRRETLELSGIKDPNDFTDHHTAGENLLSDFLSWREHYGRCPTLNVYTNWPELITNTHNAWNVKIVGDTNSFKKTMLYPSHLERHIRNLHEETSKDHTLFIMEPRPVDVAELLCWVNLNHTAFIANDWSLALYRPDITYSNTFIDLSYIPAK